MVRTLGVIHASRKRVDGAALGRGRAISRVGTITLFRLMFSQNVIDFDGRTGIR